MPRWGRWVALALALGLPAGASAAPVETVLYTFTGGNDGASPQADLMADSYGNLYGTARQGGASKNGVVFELSPPAKAGGAWTETVLHAFTGGDDAPSGLMADSAGNLYGMTAYGGSTNCTNAGVVIGCGTVFKLSPPTTVGGAWTETVLYSFTGGSDGAYPQAGLMADSNGNLYSTTLWGGASDRGTVFKLSPPTTVGGAWTETVLYSFTGGSDGAFPAGGLMADNSGNLYGTTWWGGASDRGTVFKLSPPTTVGGAWTETVLYSFTGGSDGARPGSGLMADSNSNLYGTTLFGGGGTNCTGSSSVTGCGTVFELSPPANAGGAWTETVLHAFTGGSDGAEPYGDLIADGSGNLYGTTSWGGGSTKCTGNGSPIGCGTVFELSPPATVGGAWTETVLHAFTGGSDGGGPAAGLIADSTGNLYGTTDGGGASGFGTVFKLTSTGFVSSQPLISSVSPNPVTGSDKAQPFTIMGTNFVSGANVTLRDLTAGQTFANLRASSFSATKIVVNPIFTTAAHNWSVEVINPAGQSSGQYAFKVVAPTNAPPVAKDQTIPTTPGAPVTFDLAKNATGGKATSAVIATTPAHGGTAISGTKVTYSPTSCLVGSDSFTFKLSNAYGTSNTATATINVTAAKTASATTTTTLHLVDPFLLGIDLRFLDLVPLYHKQNWDAVVAKGLVADGVSAAIAIVQTNDNTHDLTLTTTNGTTLFPYEETFLTKSPAETVGTQSLTIPAAKLCHIGGSYFAAALIQAPAGAAPSFGPIDVTTSQGSQTALRVQMDLVPPPVVLVHGIWDDRHGLGGVDGAGTVDGMAHFLKTIPPWQDFSTLFKFDFVQVLCYSQYISFDADSDLAFDNTYPDPTIKSNVCEQTSRDAITSRIYGLLGSLDSQKIVGSRVDVVAHSMGGLAVRHYSTQTWYRSYRNRHQGQFHEIVTLDTPELGSKIASFLIDHSNCTLQASFKSVPFYVWGLFCKGIATRVDQCFANGGRPLSLPHKSLSTGAVYSFIPPSDARGMAIKNLPNPNIPGADWLAVSSVAFYDRLLDNSALEYVLNNVIMAIYPPSSGCAPIRDNTIEGILDQKTNDNDAIVTRASQIAGAMPNHAVEFPGRSHTGLPLDILIELSHAIKTLSNDNVLDSADVNSTVACWLVRSGDTSCLPASRSSVTASALANGPTNFTKISAPVAAPTNKSATAPLPVGAFHADELSFTGIPLVVPGTPKNPDPRNPILRLQPWTFQPELGQRAYFYTTSKVKFTIDPPSGSSVIELDANGIVHPLKVGSATIRAQYNDNPFFPLTSQVQVNVVDPRQ